MSSLVPAPINVIFYQVYQERILHFLSSRVDYLLQLLYNGLGRVLSPLSLTQLTKSMQSKKVTKKCLGDTSTPLPFADFVFWRDSPPSFLALLEGPDVLSLLSCIFAAEGARIPVPPFFLPPSSFWFPPGGG